MKKVKNYSKKALSLSLAAMSVMSPNLMSLTANAANVNSAGNDTKVEMHVKNEYTVDVPAGINLTYNENGNLRPLYDADYDIIFKGRGNGKTLAVETDDLHIKNASDKYFVTNYLGDKTKASHIAIGKNDFSESGEIIKGYASTGADKVKMGQYEGTAEFKYYMVDTGTKISDLKNFFAFDLSNIAMGAGASQQINAVNADGEIVNDKVAFSSSDNKVATITDDGIIMTSPNAKPGDQTVITASLSSAEEAESLTSALSNLGALTVEAATDGTFTASVTVTIVDIKFDNTIETIDALTMAAGGHNRVRAIIEPEVEGKVSWSVNRIGGVALKTSGNYCTVYASDELAEGTKFNLIATYGSYSREIPIMISGKANISDGSTGNSGSGNDGSGAGTGTGTGSRTSTSEGSDTGSGSGNTEGTLPIHTGSYIPPQELKPLGMYVCHVEPITIKQADGTYKTIGNFEGIAGEYYEGDSITLPNLDDVEGYEFTGWTGANGDTPQKDVTVPTTTGGDLNYQANYKPIDYAISYNLGDGASISGQKATYNVETGNFTLPTPTKEGYTFTGWTGSNGTTPQKTVTVPAGSTGELSYTANWEKNKPVSTSNPKAGLFDASGNQVKTWDELIDEGAIVVSDSKVARAGSNKSLLAGKLVFNDNVVSVTSFTGAPMTEISFLNDNTTISDQTFKDCTSLKTVTFPKNLKVINGSAFRNCSALTTTNIYSLTKLQEIGSYAFGGCTMMTEIKIPTGVTNIGLYAFESMGLTAWANAGRPTSAGSVINIYVPKTVTSIASGAFSTVYAKIHYNGTASDSTYNKCWSGGKTTTCEVTTKGAY